MTGVVYKAGDHVPSEACYITFFLLFPKAVHIVRVCFIKFIFMFH